MTAQHAYSEIEASVASIVPYGAVFELRLLANDGRKIDSGYFNSPTAAATAVSGLENLYPGIYITPNPVNPELFARSANRIKPWAKTLTMDPDIMRRRWLLVDIDPVRPSGISSTDAEHEQALAKAKSIAEQMEFQYGWCPPMLNDSGNGGHVLWPINEDNSNETRDAIARFLKCLAARFNEPGVVVDTTVFNAARIWRLPGTWARKGDSVSERPHRKAQIINNACHLEIVKLSQVQQFIAEHEYLLGERPRQTQVAVPAGTGDTAPDDRKYTFLNNAAMARLEGWVLHFFPFAREYKSGYRISSGDLGRLFEEDLTIHPFPKGIKDFGVADQGDQREGRRTPLQIIHEYTDSGAMDECARKLADVLQVPVTEFTALVPEQAEILPGFEQPKKRYDFANVKSVQDLRKENFKKLKWIIPDILPTGNIMLASRPKMRKTWLALQLGMAIATGGKFLEWECEKGEVLFLGLEDNKRRIRSRIDTLLTFDMVPPDLSGFRFWTGGMGLNMKGQPVLTNPEEAAETYAMFPRGEEGIEALDQYLDQYPKTRAIFIDTYQHFRSPSNNRDIYARDYDAMMPLTKFASRREVLLVPVHHEKKGLAASDSGDFMEDISGSSGVTGGIDGIMSIKGRRGRQEETETRKLMLSGRDVPHDFELDMTFDAQRGGWLPAARQDVRLAILVLFDKYPFLNQQQLVSLLPNVSRTRLQRVLMELTFERLVDSTKYGYRKANPL